MPIRHIQLLGGCQLVYADKVLTTVNSLRLRSLLTYLLLYAGVPQPRQQVAFSLWSASREAHARNSLRNLLHQLRHALPAHEDFIQADDAMVVWRTEANYTLDVAAFQRLIAQATSQDETAARRALEQAVDLYQGDPFPGYYDDWIVPVRERLRLAYASALERLISLYTARNEYTVALHTAERLRQHDPLQETVYAHLIRRAVAGGDYARAHRVYEEAAALLQRELGVKPGPDRRRLYATATQPPAASDPGPPSVLAPNPEALVGRTGEMAHMQRLWRALQPGHPQVILWSGEPGIGKSRLAQAMMQWVAQQHYPTLRAHCYAGEGGFAYAPLVEFTAHTGDDLDNTIYEILHEVQSTADSYNCFIESDVSALDGSERSW